MENVSLMWAARPPEQLVSALLICAGSLAGIVYCLHLSRRRRKAAKPALALASLLCSWLLISGGYAALGAEPAPFATIALSFVIFTTIVLGIFLAALALIELNRGLLPGGDGKLMAGTSLALAALGLLVVAVAIHDVISNLMASAQRPVVAAATVAPPPATQPVKSIPTTNPIALAAPTTGPTTYPSNYPPEAIVMELRNFVLEHPGAPWVRTGQNNPQIHGMFQRVFPYMVMQLLAYPVGEDMNLQLLADIASEPTAGVTQLVITDRRQMSVNGLAGIAIQKRFNHAGTRRFALMWLSAYNGYTYEVTVWGNEDDERKIVDAAPELLKCFHILDPSRVARLPEAKLVHHESSTYAYRFDLKLARWHESPEVFKYYPQADFGAQSPSGLLAIFPVYLYDLDPDMDRLTNALLHPRPIDVSNVDSLQKTRDGDAQIYTFEHTFPDPKPLYAVYKAVRRGKFAYLITASTQLEQRKSELALAVAGFALQPPEKIDPREFTVTQRTAHGVVMNAIGLQYGEAKNVDQAMLYFRKAMELDPNPVILENIANTYINNREFMKAVLSINRDIDQFRNQEKLRSLLGLAYSLSGDQNSALRVYKELFAGDYQDDRAFELYLKLVLAMEGNPPAVAAAEKYLERFKSVDITIALANLYSEAGQHGRAIGLLGRKPRGAPFNANMIYALAEAHLAARQYNEALDVVKTLRTAGQDTAYADQLQGRAELGLRRYKESRASLEASLKKDPHFAGSDEWLRHVTTILGQGDTSSIKDPIETVAVPPELLKQFPSPLPASATESSAYVAHRITAFSFVPGQDQRETLYELTRVLDSNGVKSQSTMDFVFDPLSESIYVNKLQVYDADGKPVAEGKREDYYAVDEGGEVASQSKRLHITVPALKPGYSVELILTKRDHARPEKPRFKTRFFGGAYPCGLSAVVLKGDPGKFTIRKTDGAIEKQIDGGVCWVMNDPPPIHYEPLTPPLDDFAPLVAISDRSATWAAEGKDYLATLEARLAPTNEVGALARRLTEGLSSDEQKVSAILKHVQKELTYKAIAFGPRARMPQSVDDIVQKRFGDCKDHSLLLHHLLRSAGIPSQLALIKSYGKIVEDAPSLDQFDHMIVYSPTLQRFFDCTAKSLDLSRFAPYTLGNAQALVLDAQQPRLLKVPQPDPSTFELNRELRILESGEVQAHDVARITGFLSSGYRSALRASEPKRRTEYMQRMLSTSGHDATKAELKIQNLEEVDQPLVLEMTYTLASEFRTNAQQLLGSLPAPWDRSYLEMPPLEKRETPFEQTVPITFQTRAQIDLPSGYALRALPGNFAATDDFAAAQVTVRQEGQRLEVQSSWRLIPARHPASRYAAFQKSMSNIISALEPPLVLEK